MKRMIFLFLTQSIKICHFKGSDDIIMNVYSLMNAYDKLLKRYMAGMKYLDNESISIEEKEKCLKPLQDMNRKLSLLIDEISERDIEVSDFEIENGFNV